MPCVLEQRIRSQFLSREGFENCLFEDSLVELFFGVQHICQSSGVSWMAFQRREDVSCQPDVCGLALFQSHPHPPQHDSYEPASARATHYVELFPGLCFESASPVQQCHDVCKDYNYRHPSNAAAI